MSKAIQAQMAMAFADQDQQAVYIGAMHAVFRAIYQGWIQRGVPPHEAVAKTKMFWNGVGEQAALAQMDRPPGAPANDPHAPRR